MEREQLEAAIRNAYEAGWYAADCDEGHYLARDDNDQLIQPETADQVVARLLPS